MNKTTDADIVKRAIMKDVKLQSSNPETDHNASINALLTNEHLRKTTHLISQSQAKAYSVLETIAERHNNTFLKKVIHKQLEYVISVDKQGRNDIVEISKFKGESQHSFMDRFLNLTGRR